MLKITCYRLLKTNNTYHDKVTTKITLTNQNKMMNGKLHRRKKLIPSEVLIYLNVASRGVAKGGTRGGSVPAINLSVGTLRIFAGQKKLFLCSPWNLLATIERYFSVAAELSQYGTKV